MNYKVTIELSKRERALFETIAKSNNTSISEAIKQLAVEKLEDDRVLLSITKYEELKSGKAFKTKPIEELWKEIGMN